MVTNALFLNYFSKSIYLENILMHYVKFKFKVFYINFNIKKYEKCTNINCGIDLQNILNILNTINKNNQLEIYFTINNLLLYSNDKSYKINTNMVNELIFIFKHIDNVYVLNSDCLLLSHNSIHLKNFNLKDINKDIVFINDIVTTDLNYSNVNLIDKLKYIHLIDKTDSKYENYITTLNFFLKNIKNIVNDTFEYSITDNIILKYEILLLIKYKYFDIYELIYENINTNESKIEEILNLDYNKKEICLTNYIKCLFLNNDCFYVQTSHNIHNYYNLHIQNKNKYSKLINKYKYNLSDISTVYISNLKYIFDIYKQNVNKLLIKKITNKLISYKKEKTIIYDKFKKNIINLCKYNNTSLDTTLIKLNKNIYTNDYSMFKLKNKLIHYKNTYDQSIKTLSNNSVVNINKLENSNFKQEIKNNFSDYEIINLFNLDSYISNLNSLVLMSIYSYYNNIIINLNNDIYINIENILNTKYISNYKVKYLKTKLTKTYYEMIENSII
jgi:hypothetical protein